MFAAAAVVTSFFGSEALGGPHRDFEIWSLAGVAAGSFVATALFTIVILWPLSFWFSLSAGEILGIVDARAEAKPVTPIEAYRELALMLELNYDHNAPRVRALSWCFRLAIICLVGEVATWIAILWRM
jgi:hypothetical protein